MTVERPEFSSNATFPHGEIESIENKLEILLKFKVFNKPLLKGSCEQKTVELDFAEGYGISVRNSSLLDVLGLVLSLTTIEVDSSSQRTTMYGIKDNQ